MAAVHGGPPPGMGMAYERPTTSLKRMTQTKRADRDELLQQRALDRGHDVGCRELDEAESVRQLLRKRAGSVVAGWRADLDVRGAHFVGEADWFKVLRTIGFNGNAAEAWQRLSRGKRQVTLADLDPQGAQLLSAFYNAFTTEMGRFSQLLDDSDTLRITRPRFLERCAALRKRSETTERKDPIDLEGVYARLRTDSGALTAADFAWLEHYCERGTKKPKQEEVDEEAGLTRQEQLVVAAQRRAVREFKVLLQHRFGSIPRAWRRVLDREGNGAISGEELELAVEELQFEGADAAELWDQIVGVDADAMTLKDLFPEGVEFLQLFKDRCKETFGSLHAAFEAMESEKKPLVTKEEFRLFCRAILFDRNYKSLFDFLDERGVGHMVLYAVDLRTSNEVFGHGAKANVMLEYRDLEPLPRRAPRPSIAERAAEQCGENQRDPEDQRSHRQELLDILRARYESPVRAWGAVFDLRGRGKVSKDEFFVGCSVAGYTGSKTKLWEELDVKPKNGVRLKDIAPDEFQECKRFKAATGKQLARLLAGIEASKGPRAKTEGAKISEEEFKSLCTRIDYDGEPKSLMAHLDPSGCGVLNSKVLRGFIDERQDDKAITRLLQLHTAQKRAKWKKKLEGMRVGSVKDVAARQAELLAKGREQRAQRVEPERMRREAFGILSKRFGSLVKAWKLALNPGDSEEISPDQFIDGLKRGAVLEATPPQDKVDGYLRLYRYLMSGDEAASGLRLCHLDPRLDDVLEDFKQRCAERYGSMWQAFDEFDPEATGKIDKAKFGRLCHEIKATDAVHRLLNLFDPESEGEIELEAIDKDAADDAKDACEERREAAKQNQLLNEKQNRLHMLVEPRDVGAAAGPRKDKKMQAACKAVADMKAKLCKKHGNLASAWRKAINPEGRKRLRFEAFERVCKRLGFPALEVWRGLGLPIVEDEEEEAEPVCDGFLTLEVLDPVGAQDFAEFERALRERYTSYLPAFAEWDPQGSGEMSRPQFAALCHECQFRGNHKRVFDYMSADGETLQLSALDKKAAARHRRRCGIVEPTENPEAEGEKEEGEAAVAEEEEEEEEEDVGPKLTPQQEECLRRFGEFVNRRFGTRARAWHAIDATCLGVLRRSEFLKAISATGYAGSQSNLWAVIAGDAAKISQKEFDPEGFKELVTFRRAVVAKFSSLQRPFEEQGEPTRRLDFEAFSKMCKRAELPPPHEKLFVMLAARGAVGWSEVRFLEGWDWTRGEERPKRQAPSHETSLSASLPARVAGQSRLCLDTRPRMVAPPRSVSLPALPSPIRATWNDRHSVLDHAGNKDEQALHQVCYVQTQAAERCRRRVARQLREIPTAQWIAENIPASDDEEYDDDDDEDL